MSKVCMDDILKASLGETSSEIRASFKKTILIRSYETEVVELESVFKVDKELTGSERMLLSALLQVQLEYEAYSMLVYKGLVTTTEFSKRKAELELGISAIKEKGESILGRSLDEYFNTK